jgi:hypothetical protein
MKPGSESLDQLPVDYSRATRQAVAWLGDRYLLAVPVKPRPREQRRRYFTDTTPWTRGGRSQAIGGSERDNEARHAHKLYNPAAAGEKQTARWNAARQRPRGANDG